MKWYLAIFAGCLIFTNKVDALKCYVCNSEEHGGSCGDPMNYHNVNYMDCKDTVVNYQRTAKAEEEHSRQLQNWNPYPTEFECVLFEMLYARGSRRKFVRRCQGRNPTANFCGALQEQGNFQGYSLTKCNVCYSDYCNSSANIKISLILNFIFFLIFQRCTDS